MRIPRYQYSSPVGGTPYSQAVTQERPMTETPALYDARKFFVDPRAGQADMNLEAAALASKGKVWQALGDGITKLAITKARADNDAALATAQDGFQNFMLTEFDTRRNQKGTTENPDYPDDSVYKFKENYTTMVPTFIANAEAAKKLWGAGITDKTTKAQFDKWASGLTMTTGKQLSSWAQAKHIDYLKGQATNLFLNAKLLEDVDKIAERDFVKLSMNVEDIQKAVELAKRRIAKEEVTARFITAVNDAVPGAQLDNLLDSIHTAEHKRQGEHYELMSFDPEFSDHWEWLTADDRMSLEKKVRDAIKDHEIKRDKIFQGRVDQEVLNIFIDDTYDEAKFNSFIESNRNDLTSTQVTALRNIFYTRDDPAEQIDPATYWEIRSNLDDYDDITIAGTNTLTFDQRKDLLEKKHEQKLGGVIWDAKSNPNGAQGFLAVRRLKQIYHVFELDPFDVGDSGAASAAKMKLLAEFDDAFIELEDYLLGVNPETKKQFTDAEIPMAAWKWVKNRHAEVKEAKRLEDLNLGEVFWEKFDTWTASADSRRPDGSHWTYQHLEALPEGLSGRAQLIRTIESESGIKLDKLEFNGPSDEDFDSPEAYLQHLRKVWGDPNFLASFNQVYEPTPIVVGDDDNIPAAETWERVEKPDTN